MVPRYRGTGAPSKFTNSHLILPYPGIHSHSLAALTEASKAGAATRVTMLAEACIPLKQDDYKRKYDPLVDDYDDWRRSERSRRESERSQKRKRREDPSNEPLLSSFDLTGDGF